MYETAEQINNLSALFGVNGFMFLILCLITYFAYTLFKQTKEHCDYFKKLNETLNEFSNSNKYTVDALKLLLDREVARNDRLEALMLDDINHIKDRLEAISTCSLSGKE